MNRAVLLCFFMSLVSYVAINEGLSLKHELDSHVDFKNRSLAQALQDSLDGAENELNADNSSLEDVQHNSEPSLTESNQINASSDSLLDSIKNQSVLTSTQTSPNNDVASKSSKLTTGKVSETESQQPKAKIDSSIASSTVTDIPKTSGGKSTAAPAGTATSAVSTNPDEAEKVVLGTRKTIIALPKTVLQKTIDWMGDAYTLSILIPITAGVVFACTIISMIALCGCIRRRCRRRRLRRKALPDSVKNLTPSDRAMLLAESTDEEF